jgi:diguanylate cyclase (GGDEF)-like protein
MEHKLLRQENIKLKRLLGEITPYFELFEIASGKEIEKILEKSLDICKRETESFHGFIGILDKGNSIYIPTFEYMTTCKVKNKVKYKELSFHNEAKFLYEISIKTKKPYFTNNIEISQFLKNLPEGHIRITNFLSVPILKGDRVAGIVALSNSTNDYSEDSVVKINKIANFLSLFFSDNESRLSVTESILNCHKNDFICTIIDKKVEYANNYFINFMADNYMLDIFSLSDISMFKKIEIINIIFDAYNDTLSKGFHEDRKSIKLVDNIRDYYILTSPVIENDEIAGCTVLLQDVTDYYNVIENTKKDYETEKFISELLQRIYKGSDLNESIKENLNLIKNYLGLSQINIYEMDDGVIKKSLSTIKEGDVDISDNNLLWELFKRLDFESIIIGNINNNDKLLNDYMNVTKTISLIMYPIYEKGHIFGFISYEDSEKVRVWSIREAEFLKIVTNIIASAIIQKKSEDSLKYASTHDKLTGIYNRAYFESEIERVRGGRSYPIAFFMVDVNDLKVINDTLGHIAGDELIKNASKILKNSFRMDDCLARIGGDEFAVIIKNANTELVNNLYNRIIQTQDNLNKNLESKVSMAIGYAIAKNKDEFDAALKQADEKMYENKKLIKNGRGIR